MSASEPSQTGDTFRWRRPQEVMKLQKLKRKKKVLQARINASSIPASISSQDHRRNLENFINSAKRKNPFLACNFRDSKRTCRDKTNCLSSTDDSESSDNTLFKLFHLTNPEVKEIDKSDASNSRNDCSKAIEPLEQLVKVVGEKWIPVDWTLKAKIRFLSEKPFGWSQKLKISEEASGVTSFSRCLDLDNEINTTTALDTSTNARFHQCCLVWQQPSLPWLPLYPRSNRGRSLTAGSTSIGTGSASQALHLAFCDGLRSLHQLIRTRQCAFFYACADSFTILFRAAGIAGFPDAHALITPTTRGLRQMLKLADVEFTMPLMKMAADGEETKNTNDDDVDDNWMESMGINKDDIKQINFTQARITQKSESIIDHSDQSLVFVEGLEVQALYNFLINSCKSTISSIGPLAGVPPTLLAPVAFTGATLTPLQVREGKVHVDQDSYYSVDITGPILPSTVHNLLSIAPRAHSFTATFSNVNNTAPFSHLTLAAKERSEGLQTEAVGVSTAAEVFREKNLSDCGLPERIVKRFCSDNERHVAMVDCLKYTVESKSYAWS